MAGQQRVYRQRIRSVQATKKITRAMELIAASRVVKARQRVEAAAPATSAITRALTALATYSNEEHPLTTEREQVRRAGVIVIAGDRGLSGAYNSSVLRESESLVKRLTDEGKQVTPYLVGRRAVNFYHFRGRDFAAQWNSDAPTYELAEEIGGRVVHDFLAEDGVEGLDEVHLVYTRFVNLVTQQPRVVRLLPLEVVEGEDTPEPGAALPLYSFEPDAEEVLDTLLPRYVNSRIWTALLSASASQMAAQQRAMKSATDNAEALINTYTRLANQARQAEITQEISEIVGGASALAEG